MKQSFWYSDILLALPQHAHTFINKRGENEIQQWAEDWHLRFINLTYTLILSNLIGSATVELVKSYKEAKVTKYPGYLSRNFTAGEGMEDVRRPPASMEPMEVGSWMVSGGRKAEQNGVWKPGWRSGDVSVWIPLQPCLPAAGFYIQYKQPVEWLCEGDNMGRVWGGWSQGVLLRSGWVVGAGKKWSQGGIAVAQTDDD